MKGNFFGQSRQEIRIIVKRICSSKVSITDRCRAAYCQDSHKVFKPPIDVAVDVPKDLMRDWGERRPAIPTGSTIVLSRTLAPGKHSVNMVDWKYSVFCLVRLDHRAISRRPSSCNRVQDYGRIEQGHGSVSFIMHNRKPAAVSLGSPRCLEGRQIVRFSRP